ncbi:PAT07 [Symbiodinium sp. CCMP2592]|nr:PAT07 [Symbiodinium sp. CCMP2592]
MAKLPLVQADLEVRDWWEPSRVQEALSRQPRFVCPDVASLKRTVLCTVIPSLYFLGHVLPTCSRDEAVSDAGASAVVCTIWAALCVFALGAAACRNPGVVPRACDTAPASCPARFLVVNGVQVKQRWCSTCRVYRPLRSKHCSYCDRCVFRFDHHCTWLGNCVGLGNYRSFLLLVVTATLFFGHSSVITFKVARQCLRREASETSVIRRLLVANGGKFLYAAYALVMCLAFSILLLYHLIIMACNLTTNEHVRDYYMERNPFDITCMENYRQVLCFPYGRSYRVDAGDAVDSTREVE